MMNKLFDKSSKLRSFRESVVGVDRIKNDPFAADRTELEQYESTLVVVKHAIDRYRLVLGELNHVHDDMMAELKKFYELNENVTQRRQIDLIDTAVKSVGQMYEAGEETISKVVLKVDALLAMHVGLGTRLRDRDRAHATKSHYEAKIGSLRTSQKPGEVDPKVDRNEKKQKEANEEYDKSEQLVIRECRDALNTKFKDTDQIVGMYLKYLLGYYAGIGDHFKTIRYLPEEMMTTHQPPAVLAEDEVLPPSAPPASVATQPSSHTSALSSAVRTSATSSVIANRPMDDTEKQHNELRAALGLRVKGPPPPADSDNDSDLSTPPRR